MRPPRGSSHIAVSQTCNEPGGVLLQGLRARPPGAVFRARELHESAGTIALREQRQHDDWGGRIRRALQAHTGITTIPQIFAGGELIGGATDVIAAVESGALLTRLRSLPSGHDVRAVADPRSFLPGWLQTKQVPTKR